MNNDNYIIKLILGEVYFHEASINKVITKRLHLCKRFKIDNIHQNNLIEFLLKIQTHYYKNLLPLYYNNYKIHSKKWRNNIKNIELNKKILNTLISKINKYRLKNWYWEKIDVSKLY